MERADASTQSDFKNFQEFWPYYLSEHARPQTRWLHFTGTSLALIIVVFLLFTHYLWLIPALLVAGYGPAWYAHYALEKNHPATFRYPVWSLLADFKMWFLMLTGQLRNNPNM